MRRLGDGEEGGYDAVVVGSGYGGSVAACRMSMAGIKVCLIEKGRRWQAQDFPTDALKIMSAVRMENRNLGVSFGPKDALFQVTFSLLCGLLSLKSNINMNRWLLAYCQKIVLVFGIIEMNNLNRGNFT